MMFPGTKTAASLVPHMTNQSSRTPREIEEVIHPPLNTIPRLLGLCPNQKVLDWEGLPVQLKMVFFVPPLKRVTEQMVNVLGMLDSGHSIFVAVVPLMDATAFAAPSPDAVAVATAPSCRGVGHFRIQGHRRSRAKAGWVCKWGSGCGEG
jgi:hypothetical protein